MGRGKVELKRIENNINRQVTFSKRSSGLQKKAREISVLCDAEVALIVFSTKGKVFHCSSHSSMERIIGRYEQHMWSHKKVDTDSQPMEKMQCLEYPKLESHVQLLQRNLRNYEGQDLDSLTLRELQTLEQQLHSSLRRIQTRKNQLMHEAISDLRRKERALQDRNKSLDKQLKEKEKEKVQMEEDRIQAQQLEQETLPQDFCTFKTIRPPQELHDVPFLRIGFSDGDCQEDDNQMQPMPSTTLIPPWLLSHLSR